MTDTAPNPAPDTPPPNGPDDIRLAIDELMARPPAGLPQIIVVGDDAVSGINPLPRPPTTDA